MLTTLYGSVRRTDGFVEPSVDSSGRRQLVEKVDFSRIRKILVVKLRAIGDVLLSTVVLENIRAAFPDAQIDFLTEVPSRDVIEGNRVVNDLILFDPKRGGGIRLIADVRRRMYDLVIDLFGNPRSAIITYLSRAYYRVGYRFSWRRRCYNIVAEPRGNDVHNKEFNLDALRVLGIPIVNSGITFPLGAESDRFAAHFFLREGLDGHPVVALNSGGGWYTKRWRIPQFAQLGDSIVHEFRARVLIVWGPGELGEAKELQSAMSEPSILLPEASLKQLGAILKLCTLLVTNDSGPMHIAATLGTPVVAIFGPTNPDLQGPVGANHVVVRNERLLCLGCNFTDCPIGNPCMLELTVDEVLGAVRLAVDKNKLFRERRSTA